MSVASLSFAASLPTYESVGANGTAFANDTLAATGSVTVDTLDPSTGTASVLASGFAANGLDYAAQSFSISGDMLTVIYGLSDTATTAQKNEATDITTALSGGYPGNVTGFAAVGNTAIENGLTSNSYAVETEGVDGNTPPVTGSATSALDSPGGSNLSLSSLAANADGTIDVTFSLTAPISPPLSPSSSASQTNTAATSPSDATSTIVGLLAQLPSAGKPATDAIGIGTATQDATAKAIETASGALLADELAPGFRQSVTLYSLVAGLGLPSSPKALNTLV